MSSGENDKSNRPWRIEVRKDGKEWVRLLGNYATEENARRAIEKEALGWYFSFAPQAEFRYVESTRPEVSA